MIEREETRIYRKRYIQTQVEKTGTNKISAVFPEKNKRKFVGNFNFKQDSK